MARKRKIPVRKHHGVRDPLKQLEAKEKKLANVVNSPPTKGDEQQVSFKFSQFKKLADATKRGKKIKRIQCGHEDKPKVAAKKGQSASNTHRNIKQFVEETDEDYLKRVNRITTESIREAQYEAKYGVNVVRNARTGEITIQKRPKNEIDELLKQKRREQRLAKLGKGLKKPKVELMDPKTAKELIKRAIKEDEEEKKQAALENSKDTLQEFKRDVIQFGETVHAPPALTALPRKAAKPETVPRPGKKNNLLLKAMLSQEPTDVTLSNTPQLKPKKSKLPATITKAQMRGKRKDLPATTRAMLETERSKMIELYRQLKKSKEKTN